MIGDTMETNIRGAVEPCIPAYLLLTDSTKHEDVAGYPYQPTGISKFDCRPVESGRIDPRAR
jgi:hypothetical protein